MAARHVTRQFSCIAWCGIAVIAPSFKTLGLAAALLLVYSPHFDHFQVVACSSEEAPVMIVEEGTLGVQKRRRRRRDAVCIPHTDVHHNRSGAGVCGRVADGDEQLLRLRAVGEQLGQRVQWVPVVVLWLRDRRPREANCWDRGSVPLLQSLLQSEANARDV